MLDEHLGYVADRTRLGAFQAAIEKIVRTGDVIADVGCGTGVLGLLCLKAGASRIFAIDSTAMLDIARDTIERAGFGDRVQFIRGHSHRIDLPERVDVAICDHVGYFGLDYGVADTMGDAVRRFLKPGGRLIPARIRLVVAAVESEARSRKIERWRDADVPSEYHWVRRYAVNAKHAVDLKAVNILSPPGTLGVIDLAADDLSFHSWTTTLTIDRDGQLDGLAGWFDCELAPGVWMTNSPLEKAAIDRSQAFLPIDESVSVETGEIVKVTVMMRPADNLLAWIVELPSKGRRFQQSTWQGMLWAPQDIMRSRPERVPRLSREGRARLAVLSCCDGHRSVLGIEEEVLARYPHLFPTEQEIRAFVHQALGWDTE